MRSSVSFNSGATNCAYERRTFINVELMLDKVVNQSNILTILVNNEETVGICNYAAQRFFSLNQAFIGTKLRLVACLRQIHQFFTKVCHIKASCHFASFVDNQHILNLWHLTVLLCNCMVLNTKTCLLIKTHY